MPEPLLLLEGVSLDSESRRLFDGLDWSVPRGARVRVAAARGAGGTALLRLCAGLAHPSAGRVLLDGVPHAPYEFSHPYLRRGAVGWIPREGALVANLTLLANVALPLRFIRGLGREEAESRARSALASFDLEENANERPYALLPRERHMAALARAAAMRAELWLWNRPLDEMDESGLAWALEALREVLGDPATTVVVVGDGPEYESFAPAAVRLEGGRLSAEVPT